MYYNDPLKSEGRDKSPKVQRAKVLKSKEIPQNLIVSL